MYSVIMGQGTKKDNPKKWIENTKEDVNRGVARNLIWVGLNGSRRQNSHIKKIKVD